MSRRDLARPILQAEPSEAAVLGLILLDARKFVDAQAWLEPTDFAILRNRKLFEVMSSLHAQHKSPDIIAVDTALRLRDPDTVDGILEYISSNLLPNAVGDIEQHARIVRDMAYRRRLAEGADRIREMALGGDVMDAGELSAQASGVLAEIASGISGDNDPVLVSTAISEHWDEIDRTQGLQGSSGLETGFRSWDEITDGLQPGSVNVLAARPGMGKTSLALGAALNIAKRGQTAYVWLGEQTRREATMRLIAMEAGIDSVRLRRGLREGGMTDGQYSTYVDVAGVISRLQLYMDDKKRMTVPELVARARKVHRRSKLAIIVVDYVQLLTPHTRGGNENEQLTVISRAVKTELAELAPVLLLSQLSRDVEKRQDKHPMMSDLRSSGSLEQDADTVTLLYRESYYNEDAMNPGLVEGVVPKNRHGGTGTAHFNWEGVYTRFTSAHVEKVSLR